MADAMALVVISSMRAAAHLCAYSVYRPSFPSFSFTLRNQVCDFQVSTHHPVILYQLSSLTPRSLPPFGIYRSFSKTTNPKSRRTKTVQPLSK
ncbi:hypothetical protein GQ44DRAFT_412901 [Phaeosphaeriaceae sp. PMI808]|nr:hypothetical protein GQ44DRAFT_412901 [Phaeosphaeriaceae sp. PMI808]